MEGAGKKHWIFADGDLPPQGDCEPLGHEALMVLNTGDKPVNWELILYFEDREPERGFFYTVEARRVMNVRLDFPLGEKEYSVPFGQYALEVKADGPVVAVFGRLDVRQNNLAYYPVQGFSC